PLDPAHVRADGGDGAARFQAEGHRQGQLVLARALINIDVVDASGVDLHRGLAGLRRGLRRVLVAQNLWPAWRADSNRFHEGTSRGISARWGRGYSPGSGGRAARGPRGPGLKHGVRRAPVEQPAEPVVHRVRLEGERRESEVTEHGHFENLDAAEIRNRVAPPRRGPVVPDPPQPPTDRAAAQEREEPRGVAVAEVAEPRG